MNNKELEEQKAKVIEKIRAELNIEKWSIWQPAKSKTPPKAKVFEREITLPDGSRAKARVEIVPSVKGALTTEDQKTYYALIKLWEGKGRPDNLTFLSLNQLAKLLKKKWGTNVIKSLTDSLTRLRITHFIWKNSYYDKSSGQTIEMFDPNFTILGNLRLVKRKQGGNITKEAGYFKFHDAVIKNLLHNYTKPLLLDTVISFKSEIAQLLYTHLDLIIAGKNRYERRTEELFEDLGLNGKEYKYLSARKRVLEKALSELQGVQLSTGVLSVAKLEKTKDSEDYKAIFQKKPLSLRSRVHKSLPKPDGEGDKLKQGETMSSSQPSVRKREKGRGKAEKELFERLRSGVYREDLFSIYDNLADIKAIEELVEEAAYKAVKSVFINNDTFLREELNVSYFEIPFEAVSEIVREKFPYDKLPTEQFKRRDFFVGAICNAVADSLAEHFTGHF